MKKILMALTPILLTGTVGAGIVWNNHQANITSAPTIAKAIQNNAVSTIVDQKVYYDGDDANPNLDGFITKPIAFNNTLKRIYLPASYTNKMSASNLLMTYSQQTPITNDHKQCGYSNDNDNFNFELHDRVQDWAQYYFGNLQIKANTFDNRFGLGIIPLTITNDKLWDQNTSYKNIKNPIAYEKDGIIPTIFNDASEFNYIKGATKEFVNNLETINGVPFCYTKESQHTSGMKIWANRYLWTLQGQANGQSVNYSNDSHPVCGVYSLDSLISINSSSYQSKNIQLGLNNEMLQYAKDLNTKLELIKTNIKPKIMVNHANDVDSILELVDTNTLDENNIDALLKRIENEQSNHFNYVDCFGWLRSNHVTGINPSTLNGFGPYDNPWIVLSDIWNKLNLKIEYAIRDPGKPDQWINKMKTINLDNLASGMEIPLNMNEQGKYDFKLNSITSDTVNENDSFVYGTETSTITDHDANVIGNNNIFTLDNEQIVDATFAENNPNYNKNFYPNQIEDKMLFDAYVNLITNYGETADFNILNKDQYRVERNEVIGTINLSLTLGDKLMEHSFTGFKSVGQKIPDIDGSVDKFNISGVDLSNEEIIKLLELNHFNSYVANALDYDVIEDDNTRGVATIQVIGCNDPDLHDIYINQTFKINNLQPYFIKQAVNIDASLYKITPNKITMEQFKEYFINMSPEFQNRNLDNLTIELVPATKVLVGNISYRENTTDQTVTMSFTYDGFHQRKFNMLIIWIVVGLLCASIIGVSSFLLWKRFHKRNKHSLDQIAK